MTRRGLLGAGVAALVSGCGLIRPVEQLRYRLKVYVMTPAGMRTGSSVIEVYGVMNPDWVTPEGRGTRSSFQGEAAAVDLPNGKTLFALLQTPSHVSDAAVYPYLAFRHQLAGSHDWLESIRRLRQWKGQERPMPATERLFGNAGRNSVSGLPRLVFFDDIHDPLTVQEITSDNIAEKFGAGYFIKSVNVIITDEPITHRLDNYFPQSFWRSWAAIHRRELKNGGALKNPYFKTLAGKISQYDFIVRSR